MPQLPIEPKTGRPIEASWGAAVVRYLRALTPRGSATVRANVTPGGTFFETTPGRGTGGNAAPADHPFKVIDATSEGVAQVRIYPGLVNGLWPTVDGDSILDDPAPILAVTNVTNNNGRVLLKITADPLGSISELVIIFDEGSAPADSWDPLTGGTGYLTLALTEVDDEGDFVASPITQVVRQNLAYAPAFGHLFCGY